MSFFSEAFAAHAHARLVDDRPRVSRDGIAYTDAGEGEAILALHGGLGGYDQGEVLLAALFGETTGWRGLAVSRPGYPGSTRHGRGDPELQAASIVSLLDELAIERVVVVAISGGGPVALAIARRFPERCRALVLVSACSGPLADPMPFVMKWMMRARFLPGLADWMGRRIARAPIRDRLLRDRLAGDPRAAELHDALHRTFLDHMSERLDGLAADIEMCRDMVAPPEGAIDVPTLLVHAIDDPVVPFELAREMLGRLAKGELISPGEGGHQVLFTHRGEIAGDVAAFLDRHR